MTILSKCVCVRVPKIRASKSTMSSWVTLTLQQENLLVRGSLTWLARWLPCTLLQGSVPCSPGNLRIQFVEVQRHRDQLPALLQSRRAQQLGRRLYHVVEGPCLPTSTWFTLSPRYIPSTCTTCFHCFWGFPDFCRTYAS